MTMVDRVTLLSIIYSGQHTIPMAVYTDMALLTEHIGNLTEGYTFDGYEPTNETMKQITVHSKTVNIKDQGEFTQVLWIERRQIDYHEKGKTDAT